MGRRTFRIGLAALAIVAVLAFAPAAFGADSSLSVYGGGQTPLVEAKKGGAPLPFTGLGLGAMVLTAAAIIGIGLGARRYTRAAA